MRIGLACLLASCLMALPARAASLAADGVLGNSGEQGEALVRYGSIAESAKGAVAGGKSIGMGVVCDRFGSLWDRGGDGALNRYAPDGRLIARYPIPAGIDSRDQLTSVGDTLVLQLRGQLYTLPITAPAGTAPKEMKRESVCISFGSKDGSVLSFSKGMVSWMSAANGEMKPYFPVEDAHSLELGPDGAVYVYKDGKLRKFVDGKESTEGWPRKSPGERPQFVDGAFYGHAWHGTARRFNAEMEPDPGVVLGGASGSFIGHLDQNSELNNGRGIAKVRGNVYAISGFSGVLHLIEWDGAKRQFQFIRRIGAAPACSSLGLDRGGRVWWHVGAWQWGDAPDAPILEGINNAEDLGQTVMLDSDSAVTPGWMWGKPAFIFGKLNDELKIMRVEKDCVMLKNPAASAVYRDSNELVLLVATADGKAQAYSIEGDGKHRKDIGAVTLAVASPIKALTSMAMKEANTLLLGADGAVIEMKKNPDGWKEEKRWSSWDGDKFAGAVFLSADSGRLWVSDTERNRVVVFDLASGKALATFGEKAGTALNELQSPRVVTARGDRAVVHDSGNQRLIKLVFKP